MMATPLDTNLKGDIKKAVKLIGGFEKSLKKSDKILIKPNMNSVHPWPGGGTDAAFLEALILVLKDEGYENLTVGDTCGPWGPTDRVAKALGLDSVCSSTKTTYENWEKTKWMNIRNDEGRVPREIRRRGWHRCLSRTPEKLRQDHLHPGDEDPLPGRNYHEFEALRGDACIERIAGPYSIPSTTSLLPRRRRRSTCLSGRT